MMKALISLIFLLYSVTLFSQERITLLFVGDLMQHRAQIDAARTSDGKYDYSPCFSLIKEEISRADIAIGNLEVTLGGKPYQGYPTFSAPDEYLQAIKDAGFDVSSHSKQSLPGSRQDRIGTDHHTNRIIFHTLCRYLPERYRT